MKGPVIVASALALALPSTAGAQTFSVTSNADSGPGTLRAAVAAAGNGDTIKIPAMTITLKTGELDVAAGVTVQGAGARATTVSGNNSSRVFYATGPGSTIEDLTVTQGNSGADDGGGIGAAAGGLTLERIAVLHSTTTSYGGGIALTGPQPSTIDQSLIAHNQAADGGGISTSGPTTISNTTVAGNSSTDAAGGVYVLGPSVTFDADTLSGNGAGGQGGNVRVFGSQSAQIRDTILAAGTAVVGGGDCYLGAAATLTSLGHNAEDVDSNPQSACQSSLTGPGDHTGLTLKLGPLQNNGGPTDTLLPALGSPVVDQGDGAHCLSTDQRGVARPQGVGCDIGAVERSTPTPGSAFATTVTRTSAVLRAAADTHGLSGTARFLYGPTPTFGGFSGVVTLAPLTTAQPVVVSLAGLAPSTTYYFELSLSTPDGTVTGTRVQFRTLGAAGCVVPKLTGKPLSQARKLLVRAHCALGEVKRPHRHTGKLAVLAQSARPGTRHKAGFKVSVTLGKRRRH
jgi:hypothetical protein